MKKPRLDDLSAEFLRQVLSYSPENGLFIWRVSLGYRVRPGASAGFYCSKGYHSIQISGSTYRAHRLAWLYVYGVWPTLDIDHINGDPSDNRIANLREATPQQNIMNSKRASNKKSKYRGVRWYSYKGIEGWRVSFMGQHIRGIFSTEEDAHDIYLARLREFNAKFPTPVHPAHGAL